MPLYLKTLFLCLEDYQNSKIDSSTQINRGMKVLICRYRPF